MGAIANLVDEIGAVMVYDIDATLNVSVDVSISYISTANLNVSLNLFEKTITKSMK